jgi:hypothetical protein
MQRLNYIIFNNQWIKEKITRAFRNPFEMNKIYENLTNTAKAERNL